MPMWILKKSKYETCEICGCKSKFIKRVAGIVGGGEHLICPGEEKYPLTHEKLEKKLELLGEEHPKSYKQELKKEILILKKKFSNIPPKKSHQATARQMPQSRERV